MIRSKELDRRKSFPSALHRAGDAYLVKRGEGKTIIAGYPWFADWGRDTFIALRSSLPRPHGTLPADPLEGVRSVGAVQMMPIYGRPRLRGTASPEKSGVRTPNPEPNREPFTLKGPKPGISLVSVR